VKDDYLYTLVQDYCLEIDGVKFWTPYWRDQLPSVDNPVPLTGPYKGKGTPPQLLHNLEGYLKTSTERRPNDPELYRQLMHQLHLGVDCSAFVFYVLEQWLALQGISLADNLFKPRQDLLVDFDNPVYKHPAKITRELLESLPEQVPLSTIQDFWGNHPIRLAGVIYLTSDAATVRVVTASQVQPGDMLRSTGTDGILHCIVIVKREGAHLTYAHSARETPHDIGGVEYGEITITQPHKAITEQQWQDPSFLRAQFAEQPVHRLRVLADRQG
jgi:hypothetical protein